MAHVCIETWWGTNADGSLFPHRDAMVPPPAGHTPSYAIYCHGPVSVARRGAQVLLAAAALARAPVHDAHVFSQVPDPADDEINVDVFWVLSTTVTALVDISHACNPVVGTCLVVADADVPGGRRRHHDVASNPLFWLNPMLPPRRAERNLLVRAPAAGAGAGGRPG